MRESTGMCQRRCTQSLFLIKTSRRISSQLFTCIIKVCCCTHVMDYSSFMTAVVSRHRNTLYHTDASEYHICCFHVRPVRSNFTDYPLHPPVSLHVRILSTMRRFPLAKMLNFITSLDFCLTVHHQLGKVIQMNQLDATMIY